MSRVETAVTTLYRDHALAGLAFALTGSVDGAVTLMRAAAPRAVARGWRLSGAREARMRDALVRAAVQRWRHTEETGASQEAPGRLDGFAPPNPPPNLPLPGPEAATIPTAPPIAAHNPYAPPGSALPGPSQAAPATPPAPPVPSAPSAPASPSEPQAPQPASAEHPELSDVDRAIAALPGDIRFALALHYRADRDERAIARAMRLTRDDVLELLTLGRVRLAAMLGTSEHDVERLVVSGAV